MSAIGYKSHRVLIGILLHAWHPKLLDLLLWLTVRYSRITFTSGYREYTIHDKDSGIHGTIPLRAFDLRSRDFEDAISVRDDINRVWVYDPNRPHLMICVYHDTGFGWHFHIQVHSNTTRRI